MSELVSAFKGLPDEVKFIMTIAFTWWAAAPFLVMLALNGIYARLGEITFAIRHGGRHE